MFFQNCWTIMNLNMNMMDCDQQQREKLLYLVEKMRQIQEIRTHSPPYTTPPSPPHFRPHYDQPLDYSASKKMKTEWDKHDSLGSDGHSASDGHSDLSLTHSPRSNDIDSPRDNHPSHSPPHTLPRLSISPPASPIDSKEGILPTPILRPLPNMHPNQDMTGLLKLAGIATQLPHLHPGSPGSIPLSLPYMPSKHSSYPPPLSTSSPLPLYHPSLPHQESMSELAKIAVNSSQKYADFREGMLRNIESAKPKSRNDLSLSPSPSLTSTPTSEQGRGEKDDAYWERRRKNNEAAKRSRDARRQKENEIAMRAQFLEQENLQLKMELVQLRTELGSIKEQVNRHRTPVN